MLGEKRGYCDCEILLRVWEMMDGVLVGGFDLVCGASVVVEVFICFGCVWGFGDKSGLSVYFLEVLGRVGGFN